MPFPRFRSALIVALGPIALVATGPMTDSLAATRARKAAPAIPARLPGDVPPGGYRWLAAGPFDGPIYMVISIQRQLVHVYDGDRLIAVASVSTGRAGHRTPTGDYPILQKRQFHRSNIYSNAPMPFMQRLTWDGIALHAGHNPGYPASHGCIRLPYAFAQQLFAITVLGTLVEVTAGRLNPALMLDALLIADPGSTVVTFTPRAGRRPLDSRPTPRFAPDYPPDDGPAPDAIPALPIDPTIFAHGQRPHWAQIQPLPDPDG
ncbi:MAG: L,D-transpeptidase family protein [Sphingobium sp.]